MYSYRSYCMVKKHEILTTLFVMHNEILCNNHQQWLQVLLKHLEVIFGVLKTALLIVEDIQSVPKAKDTFTIHSYWVVYEASKTYIHHSECYTKCLMPYRGPTSERNAELGANTFQQSQQTSVPFLFPTSYNFKTYRIASTYM